MNNRYGKLILLHPMGPELEYEIAKPTISLGRASTNDISLEDARVSRSHARLDCSPQGVKLVDLGSANGTFVNGRRVDLATLVPGDRIVLGDQELRYSIEEPREDIGSTVIDTEMQLEDTIREEVLPIVLADTSSPALVVFTGGGTWRVNLSNLDQATVGRDESCTVYIDAMNVSRRHAEVQRRGDLFLLKDLSSTNGTWVKGQRVTEQALEDGTIFQVGPAQIVFKRGFAEQALTMVGMQRAPGAGRRTVIFVPGLMGSELWLGNERVWPDVKTLITNPEIYLYPSDVPLEPRRIVDEVVIVPNLIKQDQYNRLGDYLVEELDFRRNVNFFEFPYDWRQDVRASAAQLGQFVANITNQQPIILIGHSLGTMVSRYYVECLGGDKRIERLILMGGPHRGVVKALINVLVAPEVLPFGIMGERLRNISMSFPTSYQILPAYAVGSDQDGTATNFLEDDRWLDPNYRHLLQLGWEFRQELKPAAVVPSVSIFGYGIKTVANVAYRRDRLGNIENVSFESENTGDGSVLEQSAFLPGSEIHPVHQHHGALFVDNDVKMRLKIELMRPYSA